MAKRTYSVPFHTHKTEIYEVEASSPAEAAFLAGEARAKGTAATHEHVASFKIGTVKATLAETDDF